MTRIRVALIVVAFPTPGHAHHLRTMPDEGKPVILEGRISKVTARNTHIYFEIDVETADSQAVTRVPESGFVALLSQAGWNTKTIGVGDHVSVTVIPDIDDSKKHEMLVELALSNGTHVQRRVPTARSMWTTDFYPAWVSKCECPEAAIPLKWPHNC
jgi:hypothetical protein